MYVYILTNERGTFYTDLTANLSNRLTQHNEAPYDSFAKKYNCDRLIYAEYIDSKLDAIRREKQIKNWRREKKIALIKRVNPGWQTIEVG